MGSDEAVKGVIFDLDGTLLNTIGDIAGAIHPILEMKGFPTHPVDDYKGFIGRGLRNGLINSMPKEHGLDSSEIDELLAMLLENYREHPYDHTYPYDGIPMILDWLEQVGLPKAVLSNKDHSITQLIVENTLSGYSFTHVMGLSDRFPRKPDPASAVHIAECMQIAPEEIAFIGDSSVDYDTALAAGMHPIVVSWGFRTYEELVRSIPADFIVEEFEEPYARLRELTGK